jgi:chromosome partitioning protein
LDKSKLLYTSYDILVQSRTVEEVVVGTKVENLSILPSNLDLAGAEVELANMPGREYVLRESLAVAKRKFDIIIVDCPPNIGILTVNAIIACDLLIIPVQSEFYSMEALPTLLRFMKIVKSKAKTDFEYLILVTMHDARTALSRKTVQQLKDRFNSHVINTHIPRTIKIAEAPSKGIPGILWNPKNKGAQRYRELAKELLETTLADKATMNTAVHES